MKRQLLVLGCATLALGAAWANITVGPGETLDWVENPPDPSEQIDCAGGAIIYSGDDNLVVSNVFSLSAATTFSVTGAGRVRFARKFLKPADAGCLVLDASVDFGSNDSATFAYLPENAIAFTPEAAAANAAVTLVGYPSFSVLPEKWSAPIPFLWANGVYATPYGENMFDVVDGAVTLPNATEGKRQATWRIANPLNVGGNDVRVVVPSNVTCIVRRMSFNATTCAGSSWTETTQNWTNDFQVEAGGLLHFNNGSPLKYYGAITGDGNISVHEDAGTINVYGSLAEMSDKATMTIVAANNKWVSKGNNKTVRLNSSFPGKITMGNCTPTNIVSIGINTLDNKYETNSVYRFGAVAGGTANLSTNRSEVYGSRLQYNKNQKFIIGTLTGNLNVVPSSTINSCDLEIELLDNAKIYVKNGLRIRVLASNQWPEIHYSSTQLATTNAITLVNGTSINLIELPGPGKTVYVHAEGDAPCSVGAVTGEGTLVVDGGTVRVGRSEPTAKVAVRNSAQVTLGGGEDLSDLLGAKPVLWLDAAATNAMLGAWNAGWAISDATGGGVSVLQHCPAVTFNGASSATWTNGFPLIEKWFDHRPEQRLNYGWQDRCVNYNSTLYTLAYPFLVPNGLNGRPYMSFGVHGTTDLDANTYGLGGSENNESETCYRELRRMPLMQDMRKDDPSKPEGHGIKVETAIMVFGSQNGGGRALLGAYQDNNSSTISLTANGRTGWIDSKHNPATSLHFGRPGASDCYDATNGIFSTKYETFVDNESVDPTKTGLNGDWQIITVNGDGEFFRSLGMSTRYAFSGGQNYAELIVYTNKLTTTERRTVESYLAMKWNLPNGISVKGPVEVAEGAFIKGQTLNMSGAGTWRLDSPEAAPTLDGTFAGTIEIPVVLRDGKVIGDVILNGTAGSMKGRIALTCETRPRSGTYPLVSGAAAAAMPWTVTTTGETGGGTFNVVATESGVSLVVGSGGSVFIVR